MDTDTYVHMYMHVRRIGILPPLCFIRDLAPVQGPPDLVLPIYSG